MTTVKLQYSASSNSSFRGEIDTQLSPGEWAELGPVGQDNFMQTELNSLVDIWVED